MCSPKCSIFGHSDVYIDNLLRFKIYKFFVTCIKKDKIFEFYIGNNGCFDRCCANILNKLKKKNTNIKCFLVMAYIKNYNKFEEEEIRRVYNEIIFPPLSNVPYKARIISRNRWMIEQSNIVLVYVNHTWGGANKAFEYAKKINKPYVNLGTL